MQTVLNDVERDTIRRCLVAMVDGPFIEDWEFHTRIGVDRQKLRLILSEWPYLESNIEESTQVAINNCMNEIVNGVRISPAEWNKWFVVPKEVVQRTYRKWCALNSQSPGIK